MGKAGGASGISGTTGRAAASGKSGSVQGQTHMQHGAALQSRNNSQVVARYGGRSVPLADKAKSAGARWGATNTHRNGAR